MPERAASGAGWLGSLLVIVSAIAFGFMALFASWTRADGVSTEMLLMLRFAIAGGSLAMWMIVTRTHWPRGRDLALSIIMGGVLYAGMSTCYFHGLNYIPAGLVALLLYLYPVIVTVLARVLFREHLSSKRLLAIGLALAGLALTIGPLAVDSIRRAKDGWDSGTIVGIALGLSCAVCYSVYILVGGPVSRRSGAAPVSTVTMLTAAAVFAVFALPRGDVFPVSTEAWAGVLGLALLSTLLAITAFLAGLRRVGAVQASTLSTLEAATSVAVGAAFLGDDFGMIQMIGGGFILIAAIIIAQSQPKPPE